MVKSLDLQLLHISRPILRNQGLIQQTCDENESTRASSDGDNSETSTRCQSIFRNQQTKYCAHQYLRAHVFWQTTTVTSNTLMNYSRFLSMCPIVAKFSMGVAPIACIILCTSCFNHCISNKSELSIDNSDWNWLSVVLV